MFGKGKRRQRDQGSQSGVQTSALVLAVFDDVAQEEALYQALCGVPVLARTLMALHAISAIDEIIVLVREADVFRVAGMRKDLSLNRVRKVVCAKEPGFHALTTGVFECDLGATYIVIQDPRCPFVTAKLLNRVIHAAGQHGAAALAVPVRDTIKVVEDDVIRSTPDRASLRELQSPTVVESSLFKAALVKAQENGLQTAEVSAILEGIGASLRLEKGAEENIRISNPADISAAEAILQWR